MTHKKNCLITGANGLIAKSLIRRLTPEYNVYAITHSTPAYSEKDGINYIHVDFSKPMDTSVLPTSMDIIFHLAQSEHFRDFPQKAEDVFYVNTLSTLKLLNYGLAAGLKKFIYASSGGIYGFSDTSFDEEENLRTDNLGFYLGTKLCSEILLDNYKQYFDIQILRFFFVYGPGQKKNMLIPRLVENIKSGNRIQLQGKEGITINPIFVEDAVAALVNSINLNGRNKINIGGTESITLKEICEIIGKLVGKDPNFEVDFKSSPKNLIGEITKMKTLLHTPKISFAEGIKTLL